MEFRKQVKRQAGIDLSPLIDVVFLLLLFFMISTTFLQDTGLSLELPDSERQERGKTEAMVIQIDPSGQCFYKGENISLEELASVLPKDIEAASDKNVVIEADKKTEHGSVVAVMNLIKDSGGEGLTVATKRK